MEKISQTIEMSNISVVRGGREVLHVPSFSLKTNETVAILGPNGSGKSTFCLLRPYCSNLRKGKYLISGERLKIQTEPLLGA